METPERVELPPKKRAWDMSVVVYNSPPQKENLQLSTTTLTVIEQEQNIVQNPQKEGPQTETTEGKDETDPALVTSLHLNEENKGENSISAPPRPPIKCKFCSHEFATTQALGGHQNAHKKEREIQKAMREAAEYNAYSFHRSLPGMLPGMLPGILSRPLRGSHFGNRFQYHPYSRYNQGGLHIGYPGLLNGIKMGPEGFIGSSSIEPADTSLNSVWSSPYALSAGPSGTTGPINSNPIAGSNLAAFLQPVEKQYMESSDLGLSLKFSDLEKMDSTPKGDERLKLKSPMEGNESTKLDLDLKL